jgi:hypothetical protein
LDSRCRRRPRLRRRSRPGGDHRRAKGLADLFDSIRAQLRTRLDQLRPLVGETSVFKRPKRRLPMRLRPPLALASPGGVRPKGDGVRARWVRAGARAGRASVRPTGRSCWRSCGTDRGSPKPSSRPRRGSRAPASLRSCGGCSTAVSWASKRCRAVRSATGSATTEPRRVRAAPRATPARKPGSSSPTKCGIGLAAGGPTCRHWQLGVPYIRQMVVHQEAGTGGLL